MVMCVRVEISFFYLGYSLCISSFFFPAARTSMSVDSAMEVLLEDLIDLHSSSLSFRELFKSHQTMGLLVAACRSFVTIIANDLEARQRTMRIIEKVTHLVVMVALDNNVDVAHKKEVRY